MQPVPDTVRVSGHDHPDRWDSGNPALPAERLIVANGDAAELLIALGAGDKIVGVTDSTLSVPYIMDKIPNATSIGNWETPNVEQILALHPDAVIS